MKLIVDSREKKWEHIRKYFGKHGIEYTVKKLDVGDYQLDGNSTVTVDRKQNLSELSRNLTNATDKGRFMREVRRAAEQGVRLVILCEHGKYQTFADISHWQDKHSKVRGSTLQREIQRIELAYGVQFILCDKRSTGRLILEILKGETDNGTNNEDNKTWFRSSDGQAKKEIHHGKW